MENLNASDRWLLKLQANRPRLPESLLAVGRNALRRTHLGQTATVELDGWDLPLGDSPVAGDLGAVSVLPLSGGTRRKSTASDGVQTPSDSVRCLVLTDVLDAGGLDEFVAFLARRLPAFGISVTVVQTGVRGGRLSESLQQEGVRVHHAGDRRELDSVMRLERPDVVSAHAPPKWALFSASSARIPLVETLHGLPTPIGTDWRAEPDRSQMVTGFVAVSDMVKTQYIRGNPTFPSSGIVVVPNGFNDSHRPLAPRDPARAALGLRDEMLFVSMARVCLQKNTYGLVAAFAEVARTDPYCHLLVAGRVDDGLYARQVLRFRQGLPEAIRHRIHIRDNTASVSAILAAGDAFVMDSFFEGWSLASMEGLAAGLPVVLSAVGGAREQVGPNGARGYVVSNPLGDPEWATWRHAGKIQYAEQPNRRELVDALVKMVEEREKWSRARSDLARESRVRFDATSCIGGHVDVLRHAAANPSARDLSTVTANALQ